MIKTELRSINVFDTDVIHVGDRIKYEYFYVDKSGIYDWGYGKVLGVEDDAICIYYESEIDLDTNHFTDTKVSKLYNQRYLGIEEIMSGMHKIEILC